MVVRELIKKLNKIDPELNVCYEGQGIQLFDVQTVDVVYDEKLKKNIVILF